MLILPRFEAMFGETTVDAWTAEAWLLNSALSLLTFRSRVTAESINRVTVLHVPSQQRTGLSAAEAGFKARELAGPARLTVLRSLS